MASILSWGKKVQAQLNPFDHGATASHPAPAPYQPSPQVQQSVQHARYGVLANNPQAQQQFLRSRPINVQQPNLLHQNVQALGLAGARTGVGLGQGLSGLTDLATPGTGTSRVSKSLNRAAVSLDRQAKKQGVNTGYKVLQAPLNVATFLGPGVATAATKIPELGAVANGAAHLEQLGAAGRIAGAGLRGTASAANLVNAAGATGMQLGTMAGKGQKITPKMAATTGLTNLAFGGGLSAGGQAGIEALHGAAKLPGVLAKGASKLPGTTLKAAKAVANTPQAIAHEHLNATDPYYAGYNDQINQLQQAHARNAANGMAPGHPTQVQLQKSMNQLGAKTADMRQAVLQNTRDKLLMRGDPAVSQGGYVQLPGKKPQTFYRGGGEGSMPKNMTAKDILKYETDELGNADVKPAQGVDLGSIKSENLQWVTGTKGAAREYGAVSPVDAGNHRVIATDGQGGMLIEKLPKNEPGAASTQQQLAQINRKLEAFKGERTPGYDSLVKEKKSLTEKLGIKPLDQSGHIGVPKKVRQVAGRNLPGSSEGSIPEGAIRPEDYKSTMVPAKNPAEALANAQALKQRALARGDKELASTADDIIGDITKGLQPQIAKSSDNNEFLTGLLDKYQGKLNANTPIEKLATKEELARYNQIKGEAKTGTAPSTKPKPILPTAVVPTRKTLPKVSGEKPVGVSSGKDTPNNMTADSYARTFGVSKEQAVKDIAEASKPPKTKPIPKQKPAPATAAENTAKNPVKVNIPTVEPGNFEQARINPQLASHPVQFATGQLLGQIKKLGLNTSTFGRMVEGSLKPSTQAEADAVKAYRDLTDRVHATSQSLGGNTPYVNKYFRHEWDLSDPAKAAEFDKYAQKLPNHGTSDNPFKFEGLDRQPRVFKTIAQGEALGFKLKNQSLADEIEDYGSGSAHALRQQALSKALTEADMNAETKPHTFDLGGGKNVLLSDEGMKQAKGYAKNMASDNVGVKAYRKSNRGFKQILLSVSQFHPINISVLRASPTLAAEGHGLRAAKGIFDTFAAQASPKYSEKLQAAALRDGTIEDSARMGTPIKFGSDYKTEGQIGFGKGGLGEKAIFERAMPAEHIQMVKAAKQDLQEKGLSLDSPEAHALGTRINEIMGFVNTEARNLDRGTQRRLGDIFLAPQFTRSKWATNKAAVSTGGLAGSYARSAVVANAMASAFVAMGVGYALHQKSDNLNDLLLRAVFHPSVPTPLKDKKGNTIEFGLPATQSSEVLGLLGFSLKRGTDQHLHVDWKGGNVPSNVANYGRSRLAVVPANALKVATNTDYAGKPLYDPNADAKTRFEQGATTVSTGLLPIGGQGIAQTKLVKSHLPSGVQQVLNANTPGTNPMLKSAAASFGLTPRTDKTVGKGLQTTQYFDALNKAKSGLNANDKAAFDSIHQQAKNPVTGAYQVNPTIYNSQHTATTYLNNPKVLEADNKLNHTLKAEGQQIDPFFNLNPDQQNIALNYQALAQGDYRRSNMLKAYPFLNQLQADRTAFFDSLPQGTNTDSSGNSKAQLPDNLQYPTLSPSEQSLVDKYYNATTGEKKTLLNDPAIAAAVSKVKNYSASIAATRRIPTADQVPGYTPPVPKDPNSTKTGTSMKTTYDPATNTWTQVSSKTGRTTKIAADGTRTVVNAGTRSRSTGRRRSSGTGTRRSTKLATSSFKTPRINTKSKAFKTGSLKTPKFKSGHTSIPKLAKLKTPTVTVRKRAIA